MEKPQNWLIKIAHNVARTRYARASRRVKEVPLEEHVELIAVPEEDRPDLQGVLDALGRLPFNQRSALVMRELEGRTYAEIADTIGVSVSAVETLIFRARSVFATQGVRAPIACRGAAADIACAVLRHGRCRRGQRRGRGRWTAPEGGGRDRRRRPRHRRRQRSRSGPPPRHLPRLTGSPRLRGRLPPASRRAEFCAVERLESARGSGAKTVRPGARGIRDRFSARRRAGVRGTDARSDGGAGASGLCPYCDDAVEARSARSPR